jgi:uncharacterized membrane protein
MTPLRVAHQEDVRDRQVGNRLNSFYDAVIAVIWDGDAV